MSDADFEQLIVEQDGGVAIIKLNRPDRMNAWTPMLEREFKCALRAADADRAVSAIVVTGAGRAFCAGADLMPAATDQASLPPVADHGSEQRYGYILDIGKPIVAAINGAVAGVGLCIALYCDLRFMVEGAKLTTAFARRGLIAEHGSSWMLPRLIGPMNALDLLLTGRTISSEDAAAMGLVHVLPCDGFLEAVMERAQEIAKLSSSRSTRVIKRQVYGAFTQSLADATAMAQDEQAKSLQSEDFREGILSFREKRLPRFTGC